MSTEYPLPEYQKIATALTAVGCVISPSEAHGLLLGLACGQEEPDFSQWLQVVLADQEFDIKDLDRKTRDLFISFSANTRKILESEAASLGLLLPESGSTLAQKINGLSELCQGFLAGLGLSECFINQGSDTDYAEALQDLTDIARLTPGEEEGEEEVNALAEIVDYVGVSVLLIFRSLRCCDSETLSASSTIH